MIYCESATNISSNTGAASLSRLPTPTSGDLDGVLVQEIANAVRITIKRWRQREARKAKGVDSAQSGFEDLLTEISDIVDSEKPHTEISDSVDPSKPPMESSDGVDPDKPPMEVSGVASTGIETPLAREVKFSGCDGHIQVKGKEFYWFELGNWTKTKKALHHYSVDFAPKLCPADRKWVWRRHQSHFPYEHEFDGVVLHTFGIIQEDILENVSKNRFRVADGRSVETKLKAIEKEAPAMEMFKIGFFLSLCERLYLRLKYKKVGDCYFDFDHTRSINVGEHSFTVVPGFQAALIGQDDNHEQFRMVLKNMYQLIHADNVNQIILQIKTEVRTSGGTKQQYKDRVRAELVGRTVLTPHNCMSYLIDDIYWNENPTSKMTSKNGEKSYMDYHFERYGLTTSDTRQPLLVSHNEKFWGTTEGEPARLIPELCNMLDLTPTMSKNAELVMEMNTVLKELVTPDKNVPEVKKFARRFFATPACKHTLSNWGVAVKPAFDEKGGFGISKAPFS